MSPHIHRRLTRQDADLAGRSRDVTNRSFEILKENPTPDTFLGRKTQDPFPTENDEPLHPAKKTSRRLNPQA